MLYWMILTKLPRQNCLKPPWRQTSAANWRMVDLLGSAYFWQWVLMQSAGMTKAVLQKQTRMLIKVRSRVVSSYYYKVFALYLYTKSLRNSWLPKKLTQLSVCFVITGRRPSKSAGKCLALKYAKRLRQSGEVMSQTLILSKGQMMADSSTAVTTPVATPASVFEQPQFLKYLRKLAMRQTLSGHRYALLLMTLAQLIANPEQKPFIPFPLQISLAAWRTLTFCDCIHVLTVSKGCSRGSETSPRITPSAEILSSCN